MRHIDDWLFDKVFQRFAHWFQKMTGKDNFFLTYVCAFAFLAIATSIPCGLWAAREMPASVAMLAVVISAMSFGIMCVMAFDSKRRYYETKGSVYYMNSDRINEPRSSLRRLFLFTYALVMSAVSPLVILAPLFIMGIESIFIVIISFYYFSACTPLPPCKSSIRKLISAIGRALRPRPAMPAAEPVPC